MWIRKPNKKQITVQGIAITFIRSNKARRINLTVKPTGVTVSVPHGASFGKAKAFAISKIDWIKKALSRIEARVPHQTVFTFDTKFETRFHHLNIVHADVASSKGSIGDGVIEVLIPFETDVKDQEVQQFIRQCIDAALREEAKVYLPERLDKHATQYKLAYNKLSFRNAKTRWGSCSSQNNITLNIQLMRLPDRLIDYVILHELTHTKHKNHSKDFWDFLESICHGAKELNEELKQYHTEVF